MTDDVTAVEIVVLWGWNPNFFARAITLAGKAADVAALGDAGYMLMVAERTG
jgi:hypothetical protein